MKQEFWTVEEEWKGQTVAILGGGPSLNVADIERVRAAGCRIIAINNAYELAPLADILYFADGHWWEWHRDKKAYRRFAGRKVTIGNAHVVQREPGILALRNYGKEGRLCEHRDGTYTGSSGGFQAATLAVHLGAARELLLGFDMRVVNRRTQWHDAHQRSTPHDVYREHMIPAFVSAAPQFATRGVEVINCTPGSALTCFPIMSVEEACRALGA